MNKVILALAVMQLAGCATARSVVADNCGSYQTTQAYKDCRAEALTEYSIDEDGAGKAKQAGWAVLQALGTAASIASFVY